MVPAIAIPTVLAEGLLFFRRALTIKRFGSTVSSIVSNFDAGMIDELRNHRSVVGEDAFYFLLGKLTIERFRADLKLPPYSDKDVTLITAKAMINPVVLSSSVDVNTSISSFGYALGRELQLHDEATYDNINDVMMRMSTGFSVIDPVYDYFTNISSIPSKLLTTLSSLGMDTDELKSIHTDFSNRTRLKQWEDSLQYAASESGPIHKLSTFLGYVLLGSRSVRISELEDITITSGPDGCSLNISFLPQSQYLPYTKPNIIDIRGITKEMVDSASRRSMLNRGYVIDTDTREWIKLEDTTVTKDPSTGGFQFESAVKSSVESVLSSRLEHKLSVFSRAANIAAIKAKK